MKTRVAMVLALTSPLMVAARSGNIAVVKVLLAAGANVNLRNEDGKTALDHAIGSEDPEVAKVLKRAGGKQSPSNP